jgi:formate dehydrogenase major subunit
MMADGRAALFASSGPLDGPLPTHYEPFESPFTNLLHPKIGGNPCGVYWSRPDNPLHAARSREYPVIASTFRLTEQHTAGAMSRNLPWLAELQPDMFVEINPGLARERGIEDELPVPADREDREPPEGWEAARELARDPGRRG